MSGKQKRCDDEGKLSPETKGTSSDATDNPLDKNELNAPHQLTSLEN